MTWLPSSGRRLAWRASSWQASSGRRRRCRPRRWRFRWRGGVTENPPFVGVLPFGRVGASAKLLFQPVALVGGQGWSEWLRVVDPLVVAETAIDLVDNRLQIQWD